MSKCKKKENLIILIVSLLDRRFLIANAQLEHWPIIFCNDAFCDLIGYSRADILQKSCTCQFLYGDETSEKAIKQIQQIIDSSEEKEVDLALYKSNGMTINEMKIFVF